MIYNQFMIGKIINGYNIEAFIGAGQFGEVYKATKDGKTFAIKFIRKNFIYPDFQDKRFEREVAALKRVKSKYAVEIYEDGEHTEGQTSYRVIVMEFVEGETLRDKRNASQDAWEIDKALALIVEILKGLKAIHEADVIHRDLKPENIKLTQDGEVKILDYGLARVIDYSSITQTGQPVGTFFYMSPEQAKGEKPIKPGSDYYAIGVMLYELLTGQILFYPSTDAQIIHKTINVKPPYPSSINPAIPNYIENVIIKLLNKEVFQRYSSIDEVIDALTHKPSEKPLEVAEKVEFYPRIIPNDTTILEDYLQHNNLDGVDFPTNLHFLYKRLHFLLRGKTDEMHFLADPSTNRLACTNFRKTKGLRELPYAPGGYDALTPEVFENEAFLKEFVSKVIEFQVANGCNVLTAPFFFFDNTTDDWFSISVKLLRESLDYVRTKYPQYKISGAVCTQAEILCRPKERKTIIEDYGHCKTDYLQFFVDKISETTNDAQLYNFILTAKSIKDFSGTKIIACRVPTVALGLLTIGFDAVTSGLGVIDNFTKSIIIKDDEGRMPTRHYFPELLSSIVISPKSRTYQDILAQESDLKGEFPDMNIALSCSCQGCSHGFLTDFQRPRLHFLHAIKEDVKKINELGSAEKRQYFIERMDRAYFLQQRLVERGVKLNSPGYLQTWKEIFLKF